ncbi:MAG: hypothetical protein V3V48_09745 [Candidatus Aminicenantaceae bacterium]
MSTTCPKCHTDNPDSQKFYGECATPLPGIQGLESPNLSDPAKFIEQLWIEEKK